MDGMIQLDTPQAVEFGFTSDKFDGYLWKTGERITVSFIWSKHERQGHLSKLFKDIEAKGFVLAIPTPLGKMQSILEHKGFVPHIEEDEMMGPVEIWTRVRP